MSKFDEVLAETNISDYNYLSKLEQISNQARSIRGKDLVFKRPVTEEMVKDYQKQFNQPVEVEEQDEFGNPVKKLYKYIKPSMMETLEEYKPVENELSTDEIEYYKRRIQENTDYINEKTKLLSVAESEVSEIISKNKSKINELEEEISNLTSEYNFIVVTPKKSKKKQSTDFKKQLQELNNQVNKYQNENRDLSERLQDTKDSITQSNDEIRHIYKILNENELASELNESEKQRIERINKEKIRNYQEQLNMMNRGAFNIQQDLGETEEQYLKRLEDIASTPYVDEDYNQSVIHNIQVFKKNMKDVNTNNTLIEGVLNSLSVEDRYEANKRFARIKKVILDNIGYNNKVATVEDYVGIIQSVLYETPKVTSIESKEQEKTTLAELPPIVTTRKQVKERGKQKEIFIEEEIETVPTFENQFFSFTKINNMIKITSKEGSKIGSEMYVKIGVLWSPQKYHKFILVSKEETEGGFHVLLPDFTTIKSEYKKPENSVGYWINHMGYNVILIPTVFMMEAFGNFTGNQNLNNYAEQYQNLKDTFNLTEKVITPDRTKSQIYKNISGWGVDIPEELPKVVKFGKLNLLLDKLYYKNQLSVKDHNNINIPAFKVIKVSDEFVNIIMKLLKNNKLSKFDVESISSREVEVLDRLLVLSGLHKTQSHTKDKTLEKLKERLQLVEGQISAGNNNEELLVELYELLYKISDFGAISKKQAKEHFNQIKNAYF